MPTGKGHLSLCTFKASCMSVTLCKLVKIKKETRSNFTIQISFALNSSQILLCHVNVNPDLVLKPLERNMVIALDTKKAEG